jgi:ribose 1,5-bisphosphokinase
MPLDPHWQRLRGFARGRVVYVAGPSGAGKDSLLQYARERLPEDARVAFAHRYITRPASAAEAEHHIPLTMAEFDVRTRAGFFAMHWHANGNGYGIGVEIDDWLRRGFQVIVNGSRGYIREAGETYPDMCLVWVDASADVLKARLAQRGRETTTEIARRIERAAALEVPDLVPDLRLQNDRELADAGGQLLDFIVNLAANNRTQRRVQGDEATDTDAFAHYL